MNQPIAYTSDAPLDIERLVAQGEAVLLDVREKDEWDAGHLDHAQHFSLSAIQDLTSMERTQLPRDLPIYTHCKAGVRSVYAAVFLRQLGFDCRPMEQGYEELIRLGLGRSSG